MANAIPQLAWMANPDGWIFWYNQRWHDYCGTTPEQMQGWGWQKRARPRRAPAHHRALAVGAGDGRRLGGHVSRCGVTTASIRWHLSRALPFRDDSGRDRALVRHQHRHHRGAPQGGGAGAVAGKRAGGARRDRAGRPHEGRVPRHSQPRAAHAAQRDPRLGADPAPGRSGGRREPTNWPRASRSIERNARAQTQIIEDLLDMSRIISGKVRLDVQRSTSPPVVEAAIETVRPAADAKGIRIQPVLDPLAGPVTGDPNRLQQVFWNLLTNAVKFTPRGGRVQVRARAGQLAPRGQRHRHRRGHRRRLPAARLRPLPPGRRLDHAPARRPRPRAGDRQATRRAARRRGAGARAPGVGQGTTFTVVAAADRDARAERDRTASERRPSPGRAGHAPRCRRSRSAWTGVRGARRRRRSRTPGAGAAPARRLRGDRADRRRPRPRRSRRCRAERPRRARQRHRHAGRGRLRADPPRPGADAEPGGSTCRRPSR